MPPARSLSPAEASRLPPVLVAGYFPPPYLGQAVATERLASLLEPCVPLTRVPLRVGTKGGVREGAVARFHHMLDFAGRTRQWAAALRRAPGAAVLWTAVSPRPASHLRDVGLVVPALRADQRAFGVVHWGDFHRLGEPRALRPSVRALVRRLEGFVFLSERLAERCAAFVPAAKRFVIPNTVDERMIATAEELAVRRALTGPLQVLFLGTMMPEKGVFSVLDAVRALRAAGVEAEATFAGGWPNDATRARFEAEAAPLGEAVRYLGTVRERERIRALLLAHHVLALPSTYVSEAQPLVLLEAFATATPVVSTDVGGIPELVRDGQEGLLLAEPTADALAGALRRFTDPIFWQAASHAARTRFDTRFAPDVVQRAWLDLLARPSSRA